MPDGTPKPFRLTRGKIAWELSLLMIALMFLGRALTWGLRRCKPLAYHPVAVAGLVAVIGSYALSAWFTAALLWAVLVWQRVWPDHYLRHAHWRVPSFFAGLSYRHRPRRKLEANGLLNDKDPVPTISRVRKNGCTTRIHIKMSDGDEIDYWRERSTRIAQTYNAADCRINPYRRDNLATIRPNKLDHWPFIQFKAKEKVTKYRWLEIDFLTADPFAKPVGVEYIDLHRTQILKAKNEQGEDVDVYQAQQGDPVGPMIDGNPYILNVATHLLNISITGGGKSNAERTMVYAGYPKVLAGLRENWVCDLKRGVEAKPMQHCFARVEDGTAGAQAVFQFWQDVRDVMWRRLDSMTLEGVSEFTPTPGDPELDVYFDEMAILQTVAYNEYRKAIYATISEILVQGRAPKIRLFAFTQKSKLEEFPLRDDFPETHLGKVKTRRQVAMAMDSEAYGRGARANDINSDQPGIYYAETEAAMAPIAFRFCKTTIHDLQQLPACPPSALWPLPDRVTTTNIGATDLSPPDKPEPPRRFVHSMSLPLSGD